MLASKAVAGRLTRMAIRIAKNNVVAKEANAAKLRVRRGAYHAIRIAGS